jgi:hypothetical protein
MRLLAFGPGALDRRDERLARALRQRMGHAGRLVSWSRDDPREPRLWTARVSCRELPETVEAAARSRRRAIGAAIEALERRLSESAVNGRCP